MSPGDLAAWPGLEIVGRAAGGSRSMVWRGTVDGAPVAVRRSRRTSASLAWELALMEELAELGFLVPSVVVAADGRSSVDGLVVQRWIDGVEPTTQSHWHQVGETLQRLHALTSNHSQRPGCADVRFLADTRRSVDADLDAMPAAAADVVVAVFAAFDDAPSSVIHGDPGPGNIRITHDGRVGLIDWDESRVDISWHDLSNLGLPVLEPAHHARAQQLSDAWEAANAWQLEPEYARRRLNALR